MLVPIPGHSIAKPDWISNPGTSFAAPQIGGIAALLLQKKPGLAPDDIRTAITKTARDITAGTTALGHKAAKGPDLATGAGLVSALDAWRVV
jgi:subtilisin family serine protease